MGVKSNGMPKYRRQKGKIIKGAVMPNGYRIVLLTCKGVARSFLVSRLVLMAMVPNPKNLPCVNHWDGNKANNHVNNLEWVTQQENMDHAAVNGLMNHIGPRGEQSGHTNLTDANALEIRARIEAGESQKSLAAAFGVGISVINNLARRHTWKHLPGKMLRKEDLRKIRAELKRKAAKPIIRKNGKVKKIREQPPVPNCKKLVYADAEAIRKLWQNDRTIESIAKEYGISTKFVTRILDNRCFTDDDKLKPGPRFLNEDNVREIRKQAKEGATVLEISERIHLTEWLTRKVVKRQVWAWFEPED